MSGVAVILGESLCSALCTVARYMSFSKRLVALPVQADAVKAKEVVEVIA